MKPLNKFSQNIQLINTDTGTPTEFFVILWQDLLTKVESIDLPDNPADGSTLTLTYDAARRKWIGT